MNDFDYFENWNKPIRWILFIPIFFPAYIVIYYLGKYLFWYGFGLMGFHEESGIGFLIYHFYLSFLGFFMPITISVSCAPKGKVLISSIYLGLVLLLAGFSIFSLIVFGDSRPLWKVIYDYTLNVAGSILALLLAVDDHKKRLKHIEFEKNFSS